MSYSGTVGNTVISVQTLIDHGARRAGKLAEELTDEQYEREETFLLGHIQWARSILTKSKRKAKGAK